MNLEEYKHPPLATDVPSSLTGTVYSHFVLCHLVNSAGYRSCTLPEELSYSVQYVYRREQGFFKFLGKMKSQDLEMDAKLNSKANL
jgi:hypothetical protein